MKPSLSPLDAVEANLHSIRNAASVPSNQSMTGAKEIRELANNALIDLYQHRKEKGFIKAKLKCDATALKGGFA